jgi:hypothetical protein
MLLSELNKQFENLGLDLELDDAEQYLIIERRTGDVVAGFSSLDHVHAAINVAKTVLLVI